MFEPVSAFLLGIAAGLTIALIVVLLAWRARYGAKSGPEERGPE